MGTQATSSTSALAGRLGKYRMHRASRAKSKNTTLGRVAWGTAGGAGRPGGQRGAEQEWKAGRRTTEGA